ncbi:MAG: hypothetical protein D6718_05010 [Acidobacteria bacterium]|nr:MAG: hypothetical protein D6718_05010 [Acidobacteriota bacterium]
MRRRVITLLTDFGREGPYAGEVAGVLLSRAPEATLCEISHEVAAHDVREGAFVLAAAAFSFPRGTVHLAVVDPGVGTARRALAMAAGGHLFVAPDNGLLTLAARRAGGPVEVREVAAAALAAPRPHPTFHGRDLFAPVAAALACGLPLEDVGPPCPDWIRLPGCEPEERPDGRLVLPVLHVDRFGNVAFGLTRADAARIWPGLFSPPIHPESADGPAPFVRTYGEAARGQLCLLWGSSGYLEAAVREGRADTRLGVRPGDRVPFIRR